MTGNTQLIVTMHQPLGADTRQLARALQDRYEPLLTGLEAEPKAHVALHISGWLLAHITKHREALLFTIKRLAQRGQVEVVGGAFYGASPALIPEVDLRGQFEMTREFWYSYLGTLPVGYWPVDLHWSVEAPRLLADGGLHYSFVAPDQIRLASFDPTAGPDHPPTLSTVYLERAGHRIPAFVLDPDASKRLTEGLVPSPGGSSSIRTAWLRAEAPGTPTGSSEWGSFFRRLVDAGALTDTPKGYLERARPASGAFLDGTLTRAFGGNRPLGVDRPEDVVSASPTTARLYRRMIQVAQELRDAVAWMEDEGLEESVSDQLATAQRMLFAAQCPDAYSDPWNPGQAVHRDQAWACLLQVEQTLSQLRLERENVALRALHRDIDGDGAMEALITTAAFALWVRPAHSSGLIAALDDFRTGRSLLDVDEHPVSDASTSATGAPENGQTAQERAAPSTRIPPLGLDLEIGIGAAGGTVRSLHPTGGWQIVEDAISRQGDAVTYRLTRSGRFDHPEHGHLVVEQSVVVPEPSEDHPPGVQLTQRVLAPVSSAIARFTLPVRLGPGKHEVVTAAQTPPLPPGSIAECRTLRIRGVGGTLALEFEPPLGVSYESVGDEPGGASGSGGALGGVLVHFEWPLGEPREFQVTLTPRTPADADG